MNRNDPTSPDGQRPGEPPPIGGLPPYSYVPGKFPHPTRDPLGHSFGKPEAKPAVFSPEQWSQCRPYVMGIEYFNRGYYWEAHESWEAVWHSADRRGVMADMCKALIKLAAAGVKAREGRANGVLRHARRGKQLLDAVIQQLEPATSHFMGLCLADLRQAAEQLIADPDAVVDQRDDPVVVVMPFVLDPHRD